TSRAVRRRRAAGGVRMSGARILVVADAQDERDTLRQTLAPQFEVRTSAAADAGRTARDWPPDLAVGAAGGERAFRPAWRAGPHPGAVPVLGVTGAADEPAAEAADDYLTRPLHSRQVLARVRRLLCRPAIEHALQEADRRRDRFLATLAHELRNPLAPIRNALEILRTPDASAADTAYARDLLERQVRQMVRLIDDLVDVARLRLDKIELRPPRGTLGGGGNAPPATCRPAIAAARQ